LLEDLSAEELSAGLRARILARLGATAREHASTRTAGDPLVPAPLDRHLGGPLSTVAWRHLEPGVRHRILLRQDWDGTRLQLLRIAAGRKLPRAANREGTMILVLTGSITIGAARLLRGDAAELDGFASRALLAGEGEDCICLIGTGVPARETPAQCGGRSVHPAAQSQ
jgi:putative transcriptional regulator